MSVNVLLIILICYGILNVKCTEVNKDKFVPFSGALTAEGLIDQSIIRVSHRDLI